MSQIPIKKNVETTYNYKVKFAELEDLFFKRVQKIELKGAENLVKGCRKSMQKIELKLRDEYVTM